MRWWRRCRNSTRTCAACCQVFLRHTSAPLTLNENVAEEVLADFRSWFDECLPKSFQHWTDTEEGPNDMPARIKSSLLGSSVTIPILDGALGLACYMRIYLCEHRTSTLPRTLALTAWCGRRAA